MGGAAPAEPVLGIGRSATGRRWVWRNGGDGRAGLAIAQRLDLPELVGRLLAARGVPPDAAMDFLEPTLRALLPDPSVLADMDAAAARLASAVLTRWRSWARCIASCAADNQSSAPSNAVPSTSRMPTSGATKCRR